jgi:hypothetical protein
MATLLGAKRRFACLALVSEWRYLCHLSVLGVGIDR